MRFRKFLVGGLALLLVALGLGLLFGPLIPSIDGAELSYSQHALIFGGGVVLAALGIYLWTKAIGR